MILNDLCNKIIDCEHKTAPTIEDSEYAVIRTPDIGKGRLNFDQARKISVDTYEIWTRRATPQPGDLIFAREAPVGNVAIVLEGQKVCLGQRTVLLRPNRAKVSPEYLCYYLLSEETQGRLLAKAAGATVLHVNMADIRALDVPYLPPLEDQIKAASIITVYDDLIAANQRRIQLLEESARLLYCEWFVRLRFPGYETATVTNGVPEGWERKTLGDYATLNYGKGLKETDRIDGDFPVYGSSGIVGYHDKPLISGPVIIVGRKGTVGSVYYSHCPCFPIDTVYFISSDQASYYLYLALQGFNFISSDAAVPGLNRNYAYSQQLLVPNTEIFTAFEANAQPVFEQINSLTTWNEKLRQARDMLLPRLMSGHWT